MLATEHPPATAASGYSTEFIHGYPGDEVSGFDHVQGEWDELLRSSRADCLFLTQEWLSTWWKHLADDRDLSLLTVRRDGELCGLAPLCLRPPVWSRCRPYRTLEFLGAGHVGSDYLDFILHRDHEEDVRQAMASALAEHPCPLELTQLRKGSSATEAVAHVLAEHGWGASEAQTNICPYIALAGHTWDSYLASLGSEHRYNFNRKWKRLNKDFTVRFEEARTDDECEAAIGRLIYLHNLRWRERGGSDAFHTPGLVSFHHEFSRVALHKGWLRLYSLWLNDKPAASLYGFRYGRTFYFYQSGFHPGCDKYSVGLVIMGLAIQAAIAEGAEEFDLLHGAEPYKFHWSRNTRELGREELFPPGGFGAIWRASLDVARASRGMAQRLLRNRLE